MAAAVAGSGPGASSAPRVAGGGGPGSSRWFFTREQLENTPSRRCGVEADKELSYRQQAANLIQDMGQRLNVYPYGVVKKGGGGGKKVFLRRGGEVNNRQASKLDGRLQSGP